jgi:hypothetical protein
MQFTFWHRRARGTLSRHFSLIYAVTSPSNLAGMSSLLSEATRSSSVAVVAVKAKEEILSPLQYEVLLVGPYPNYM